MAVAAVLAGTAPDDFRRRIIGRWTFVYCHEFIRWARRAKNEVRRRSASPADVRVIEHALDELELRDWGSYEDIRHRIAAHRRRIPGPLTTSIPEVSEMWTDISDAAVRILSADARTIWNGVAAIHGMATLDAFPPISAELKAALDGRGYEASQQGLVSGVGSFDATRGDAVFVIQGGDLGEQNRQIVDAIRNVRVLSQLWHAVNGHPPYAYVVVSAVVTEACTLRDLMYGAPSGPAAQEPMLVEILQRDVPQSLAISVLAAGRQAVDPAAVMHVKNLRNRIGAHVDEHLSVSQIVRMIESFDPTYLNAVIDNAFEALTAAARVEPALRPILMHDAVLKGFGLGSPPELARPYDE